MTRREVFVVVDLGCGDQGKGTVTDFLVRDRGVRTVVRYNGGAQAGHNVVTPDGRHHTFAQFGAGTFVPGVRTVLSRHVAIQPWAMSVEAEHLARVGVTDAFERTLLDGEAPVITAFHRAANRLRERARGALRHGSCGVGVGEAVSDARTLRPELVLRARDLFERDTLRVKLRRVQEHKRAELAAIRMRLRDDPEARHDGEHLDDVVIIGVLVDQLAGFVARARVSDDPLRECLRDEGAVVFEGAQGVLLDENHGFHPYTTWSTCTATNALELLSEQGYDGAVRRLGVVRAYATRHGRGPMVTEDAGLTARLTDPHNRDHPWQGGFRVGWFDAVSTRYAIGACGGVDALAVTCLDRLRDERGWKVATAYEAPDGARTRDLLAPPGEDLDARAAFSASVMRARPVYELSTACADIDDHLAMIAAETCDVGLISYGPSARDKRWR